MLCPVCKDVNLVMSERSGVEIDYCPSCRGVWLDRGELDKIIERSTQNSRQNEYFGSKREYERPDRRYDDRGYHDRYYKKKKESFLSELFDF
ncbi:MAG: zf-TFIIB domain-containing protein [Campylobacter lanienae]|uniref:TFIIB-type zinc ribbon-containing protein n=1 Tax=Campylobacter lanienae TaxID=75658 RepID=UPI0021C03BA9|nr:zf-TFIIB domain-containing protein [Campylobacter lanienae]MCI7363704.1 zf-TFIIB domain-containing protein [Campylobacter lanienae]MDY6134303.1 zf-TFIIB domain-containing protein [Campylobacter lanienae]